jgi:capsular polysaccharide biosynthesis protein
MISAQWDAVDFDDDQASSSRAAPILVSLHFVRSALRRRWLMCVLSAVLGLLAAATMLVAFPALHDAKATLVLVHDPLDEPSQAMATDVSLLQTRTLAEKAVASLRLTMTPDDFLKTIKVESVSSELLSITLTGPSDAEAVRRLQVLASLYLGFRGEQLSLQSKVYLQGIQQRITKLQTEVGGLSEKIEQLSRAGSGSASKVNDAISQRAFVQGRIDTLQQEIEDVTLQTTSVVLSSRVIDPAAVESHAAKRRIVLALASGLVGGAALGCGIVLFLAIMSDRLRRRADVAAALEVPVAVSVGRITPVPRRWLWLPHMRKLDNCRTNERQKLARTIEMALPTPRRSGRLAVVCIDNDEEVRFAVAVAAMNLGADGRSVAILDLTKNGTLGPDVLYTPTGSGVKPVLLRPPGIPTLAGDITDLRVVGDEESNAPSLDLTDATLVIADLDPSIGADYLLTWTQQVMIVVTSGRSSAERVTTAADLVRTAGLETRVAALLHPEPTDDSSGTGSFDAPVATLLVDGQDDLVRAGEPAAEKRAAAEEQNAAEDSEDTALHELVTVETRTRDEEQPSNGEPLAAVPAAPVEEELVAVQEMIYDDVPAAEDDLTVQQRVSDDQPTPPEEQQHRVEWTPDEELSDHEDGPTIVMPAFVALEPSPVEEQAAEEQEQTSVVKETPAGESTLDGEPIVGERLADHEGARAEELTLSAGSGGQLGAKVQHADEEEPDEGERAADHDQVAYARERSDGPLSQQSTLEYPLAHVELAPDNDEFDWSWDWSLGNGDSKQDGDVIDAAGEVIAEPDEMASHRDENVVNGWYLYADAYPHNVSFDDISDKELDWSSSWDSDDLDSAVGPDHDEPQLGGAEPSSTASKEW